jgi:heat shock protein HtpX
MKIGKRIFLFLVVNLLIVSTISVVLAVFGVKPYLDQQGINYTQLALFCAIWGFGGAFISLALSRVMAKWMMGVQVIDPQTHAATLSRLVRRVHELSKAAGLPKMPEVGYYESPELNAFATGPTKSRALVAVSSGLLQRMSENEVDGVLAHEVAHIANGDMVTMTLVQGVVNAFVMFFARVLAYFASQFVDEEKRGIVNFAVVIVSEIAFGILGMIVVAKFSRAREFRADSGGAKLAGTNSMIAALAALKANYGRMVGDDEPALATLKISGKSNGFARLFSTHPDLDDRIERLRKNLR